MKAQKVLAVAAVAVCAMAGGAADAAAQRGAPLVDLMVAFPGGRVIEDDVRVARTTVPVGRKTCAVPAATPMAALALRRPARIRFVDYGSCSARAADASGLFVKAIGRFVNEGLDGWVYKVGRKLGTAGGADPTGPFGEGRLRRGNQVLWFYCVFAEGSCQRSLGLETRVEGRELSVSVDAYDDEGEGIDAGQATVVVRPRKGEPVKRVTDGEGRVSIALEPGRYEVFARKRDTIRSFGEAVEVR